MSIFYAAVEDDPLDSGGRIIEGGGCGTVKGDDGKHRRLAFLGQKAWCETCNSAGIIAPAPGAPSKQRLYDRQRGERQALGGDLVICKCERHPRILSTYGRKWKIVGNNLRTEDLTRAATPAASVMAYDDRFVLCDAEGTPLARQPYTVRRESGVFEYGETDDDGRTHLLTPTASAEAVNIYIAG